VVKEARDYIIREQKPAFIVENTYRTSGHSKSDGNAYRTKEEIADWKSKNPVIRFTNVLLENGFTQSEIDAIDVETTRIIEDAVIYAEACPNPTAAPEEVEKEVYA